MTPTEVLKMLKSKIDAAGLNKCNYAIETSDIEAINQALLLYDVMPSGFTLQQENAIWGVIRFLAKEQHKDPRKVRKRADVFKMIKDELDILVIN